MADWFDENSPQQATQPQQDWFAQNAPQVATQERSIPSKIGHAVVDTLKSFVPQSFEEAALAPVKALPGIGKVGTILSNIAFGKPIAEGLDPLAGIPVVQRIPQIIQAEKTPAGSQERFTTAAGTLLDLGMIAGLKAAPEIAKPKIVETPLAEVSGIAKPEVPPETVTPEPITPVATDAATAETETATQPNQFTTTVPASADQAARNLEGQFADLHTQAADIQSKIDAQRTAASSATIPEEQVAANREIAPLTEPPSATAEPFPSISQSAEDVRRTELQQEPPKVREAISLDEIRLIREKNELQAQNEIAKQATGVTHPAVDERIGQIDEELTNIANKELQPSGIEPAPIDTTKGEPNAIQEPSTGEILQRQPQETGTTGSERVGVEQGQQGQKPAETLQTAAPQEQVAPKEEAPTGISNQRLTEAYGDSAPVATTGKGAGAWKDEGLTRLGDFQKTGDVNNDPYSVLTNLRKGQTTVSLPSDVSLLRAEHQRLLEDARNAEGTPDYADKSKAALDMATAIKDVAHGPASDVFRALQEYDKPRYDNVTDFDQALRERENRESTPEEKAKFKKIADDVASTRNGAEKEINVAQKRLNKFPKMSFDDASQNIRDQITQLTKDCVI